MHQFRCVYLQVKKQNNFFFRTAACNGLPRGLEERNSHDRDMDEDNGSQCFYEVGVCLIQIHLDLLR